VVLWQAGSDQIARKKGSMALVVFLKGVNVGGHRTFRPSKVAERLKRFRTINIGAAGTYIIPKSIGQTTIRTAIRRLIPFDVTIIICDGHDILELAAQDPFAGQRSSRRDIVQFISVQAKRQQPVCDPPFTLPTTGQWCVRVLAHYKRFVVGVHRREMRAIKHLGQLENLLGGPITTRSWSTILTIARLLGAGH
jgi:uncharacterized protein (DUF1697 family)